MDYDVAVVGAGPAGCLAARDLAKKGLSVGLFDASTRAKLGTPVIIEAESTVFKRVGVDTPTGDDVPYEPNRVRVFSARRKEAYSFPGGPPTVALYLDRFVRGLREQAEQAGAHFQGGFRARKAIVQGRAVVGAEFEKGDRTHEVRARLVVDATGYDAALVHSLNGEVGIDPADDERDTVVAANAYHEIDPDKARRAVSDGRHGDEELWTALGLVGPYSTEFSFLSIANRRGYILIGHKAEYNAPPLTQQLADFRKRQGYYGKKLHGGQGKIRIAHTRDRIVADGFLAVGEAACMVIPLLGSGVASGMLSGALAAKVIGDVLKSGTPTTESLWPYAATYQRGRGAVLASIDATRLISERFTAEQSIRFFEEGLSGPEDLIATSKPATLSLSPKAMVRRVVALAKNPDLVPVIARLGRVSAEVNLHHRLYPRRYSPDVFAAWKAKSRELFARLREPA